MFGNIFGSITKAVRKPLFRVGIVALVIISILFVIFYKMFSVGVDPVVAGGLYCIDEYGESLGGCTCYAHCVRGADLSDLREAYNREYPVEALWANGFYLSMGPSEAAIFMSTCLALQSESLFSYDVNDGVWCYEIPNPSYYGGLSRVYLGVVPEGCEKSFVADDLYEVDFISGRKLCFVDTGYIRWMLGEMGCSVYDVHSALQTSFDLGGGDYLRACSVGDWEGCPEISATAGMLFRGIWEAAAHGYIQDADYESMATVLSAFSRWYVGVADEADMDLLGNYLMEDADGDTTVYLDFLGDGERGTRFIKAGSSGYTGGTTVEDDVSQPDVVDGEYAGILRHTTISDGSLDYGVAIPHDYKSDYSGAVGTLVTDSYGGRALNIYLPAGYTDTKVYPVLYFKMGTAVEATRFNNHSFNKVLDNAIGNGDLPPMVFVAIQGETGGNWLPQDCGTGISNLHALVNYVEGKYSCGRSADFRAVAGWSRGCQEVAQSVYTWKEWDMFGYVGLQSAYGYTQQLLGEYEKLTDVKSFVGLVAGDSDDGTCRNHVTTAINNKANWGNYVWAQMVGGATHADVYQERYVYDSLLWCFGGGAPAMSNTAPSTSSGNTTETEVSPTCVEGSRWVLPTSDSVYKDFRDKVLANPMYEKGGDAVVIYLLMCDNKRLGVNLNCDLCEAGNIELCEGCSWAADYTSVLNFVADSVTGPTGGGGTGKGLGNAEGEYSWSLQECTGDKSYYAFMQGHGCYPGVHVSPNGENLDPHTMFEGVDYADNACGLVPKDGSTATNSFGGAACPIFSFAVCLSNITGEVITPLELSQMCGWTISGSGGTSVGFGETQSGVLVRPNSSFYCRTSLGNFSAPNAEILDCLGELAEGVEFVRFESDEQVKACFMDSTMDTVVRVNTSCAHNKTFSLAEYPVDVYSTGGTHYDYDTRNPGSGSFTACSGHFYSILDYDPVTDRYLCFECCRTNHFIFWAHMDLDGCLGTCIFQRPASMRAEPTYPGRGDGAQPISVEEGRTDSAVVAGGVQLGQRRFDGSWYTEVTGWTVTDRVGQVGGTSTDKVSGATETRYFTSMPFDYPSGGSVYYLDLGYYQTDTKSWLTETAEDMGVENPSFWIRNALTGYDSGVERNVHNTTQGADTGYLSDYSRGLLDGLYSNAIPGRLFCGSPLFAIAADGTPVADTYWECYSDASGLYKPGHLFGGFSAGNYNTNVLLVLVVANGNQTVFVPVTIADAKAHYYPFACGQTFLVVDGSFAASGLNGSIGNSNTILRYKFFDGDGSRGDSCLSAPYAGAYAGGGGNGRIYGFKPLSGFSWPLSSGPAARYWMNGGINCNLTLNTSNLGSSYGEFTVGEYVSYLAGNNLLPVPDNAVALETESQAFAGAYGRARGTSGKSWISILNIEADAGVVSTLNQFGGLSSLKGIIMVTPY